ncbi:MAG TPA: NRAMP family divalent metal transporter [Gemmatimonadaceae bacterium]|nr:NRAMP family divalent metal transporter [Gemmatimonadaceae bacterium]
MTESRRGAITTATIGAAFLMATSAIGPGFLTQTAVFTAQLGASFGFAILVSILFDLGAQLNTWRVLAVARRRAQDVANDVLPGLGHLLAALVALGGLAFNIGNIAGTGLGLNALAGIDVKVGAAGSAAVAVGLFLMREAGRAMDRFAQALGVVMIALTGYVVISAQPPIGEAVIRTFAPLEIDPLSIVTIVGGTVGGYITFAGAHRLIDAGLHGRESLGRVTRSAALGIGVASLMRILLFLSTLGVITHGATLDPANPPASAFQHAAGDIGQRLFGVVMWAAAITSVVGSAYTSVSFLRSVSQPIDRAPGRAIIAFIVISAAIFLAVGRPVTILVLVGAINGMILPLSLGAMLVAAHRVRIVGEYRHPAWLTVAGVIVAIAMAALGVRAILSVDL